MDRPGFLLHHHLDSLFLLLIWFPRKSDPITMETAEKEKKNSGNKAKLRRLSTGSVTSPLG